MHQISKNTLSLESQVALQQLISIYHKNSIDFEAIIALIQNTPQLAEYIIHRVNSVFYGTTPKFTSIAEAIDNFDRATICGIALALAIRYQDSAN